MSRWLLGLFLCLALSAAACSTAPDDAGLRAAFVTQLAANRFVKDLQQSGDDLRFTGPGANGEDTLGWRVRIESATIESSQDAEHPYRGVVKSSWYANDQPVVAAGSNSGLPLPLTSNGLAQECWALWDKAAARWSWE